MNDTSSAPAPPTQDETTMALLAHVLQIFTWWIGPLVIYLVRRESKFVSFHALQALFWQITMVVVGAIGMGFWIFLIFAMVISHAGKAAPNHGPPPVFFLVFPLFWLGFLVFWVANIVIGVVFGIKAGRGEWASYPLLGRWARRVVGV